MIRAVIFDLDNTLTDFMQMKRRSIEAAVDSMIDVGLKMIKEEAVQKIYDVYEKEGIEYQNVFDRFLLEELGEIDYKIFAAGIVGYRKAREAALVLYPHTNETLIILMKMGIRLAILSDAPRLQAWLRLCYLKLHHLFDVVITYEDTMVRKPHPAPFRLTIERLRIRPEEAIMVGDWEARDVKGAKELGIVTVFARYGNIFSESGIEADYTIDDIIEIVDIINEINRPKLQARRKVFQ
ncbi:MAG: HAD-IIIA family hydrolase [bacterium]